ncbi:hypothetical protein Micbo1qcDRAFT_226169 [Microdochium bolleyi]|uniref:Uncharacterized protein n=1 Tax=Microdochium bolleyi TaxID=196109 RepID=A0A136IIW0_9PEZI|nr:hypothetical protein Micbo1qcDRAFT_226169 [Microdochium bolleyi]
MEHEGSLLCARATRIRGPTPNRGVRVAYKNLCFGGFVQTWEQALALAERAAMPHLGLMPGTFNMAGAVVWPVIYTAATKCVGSRARQLAVSLIHPPRPVVWV